MDLKCIYKYDLYAHVTCTLFLLAHKSNRIDHVAHARTTRRPRNPNAAQTGPQLPQRQQPHRRAIQVRRTHHHHRAQPSGHASLLRRPPPHYSH